MSRSLKDQRCQACEGGIPPLGADEISAHLSQLSPDWTLAADQRSISARFSFRDYYRTCAFVNAVAWIAHRENHHPDISFGYRECTVSWTTHAASGLTLNDFICAAKIDDLIADAPTQPPAS